jgi:hypothetical protein
MIIRERDQDGKLKETFTNTDSRIFVERIKKEELTLEDVPEALRDEVQALL